LFGILQQFLVVAGFAQVMHGIIIYTGGCRGDYLNGCLAHVISEQISTFHTLLTHLILGHAEGGIFWCYGLATFARFLGSFSELGWAWNRAPSGHHVSAEFVESFVIFFYGITNTWMERFGAHPGDPYTNKQIQHISIAVMFWFAGLVGMGLESRRLRRWLAAMATASLNPSRRNSDGVAEPASYAGSFNPFPALVIGVTGAAMSAHFQTYLFQVSLPHFPTWGLNVILVVCANAVRTGPNTCPLGLLSHWVCRLAMSNLFLRLARPAPLCPSLSSSVRSPGKFPPGVRRSHLHLQ
jgi:hypothetical protein